MVAGALAVTLAGPFFDGSVVPMVAAIAACAVSAAAIARLVATPPSTHPA